MLGAEEAQGKAQLFKALADPNRLRLLSIVNASDGGEACVCDLTEPLDLGQPTVSHHLKILVDAGLLHRESAAPGRTTPWCPARSSGPRACSLSCRPPEPGGS